MATLLWAALILVLTSIPGPDLPRIGGGDKLGHTAIYFGLGWLAMRAARISGWPRSSALWVLLGASLFGAVDEWHQHFIIGRSADRMDWLADTVGAALGILLAAARPPRRESRT